MNRLKTAMLLAALTALMLYVGQLIGGEQGVIMALIFAAVMNVGSYWFSDRIVLAMYRAKEIPEAEAPRLYDTVRRLSQAAGIPMPRIYLLPEQAPNAFATGRNPSHAAVAVTAGIMELLSEQELTGVLGHELSHVINRDTLISTIAATIAGALSHLAMMGRWGMMFGGGHRRDDDEGGGHPAAALAAMLLAPIAAALLQMAISRSREFMADHSGAVLTGDPLALASALKKIEGWAQRVPFQSGNPSTASLFIINPLTGASVARLFSTHPPTAERVRRLEEMAMSGEHLRA